MIGGRQNEEIFVVENSMHSYTESVMAQESTFFGKRKTELPVESKTKNDDYAESMTLSYVRNIGSEAISMVNKSPPLKTEFTYRNS